MTPVQRRAHHAFLVAGALVLICPVLRELDPTGMFSRNLSLEQFLALELHAALVAFWAHRAANRERGAALWLIPAAAAIVSGIWMIGFFGSPAAVFLAPDPFVIGFGCTTIALVLLAGFEAAGRALLVIVLVFLAVGFVGQFAPDWTSVPPVRFTSYVTYLAYGSDGLFGRAMDIISNVVLVFVIFGVFFDLSGGGEVVSNIALRLAGHNRAGAIKACVIASGLFGTVSGAATSNVMTSGTFSIPSMRRIGVRNETAAGIEAAVSTCGQVTPPVLGAAAFFLADLVGVSYSAVVIASVGPALACYLAFFRQADLVPLTSPISAPVSAPVSAPASGPTPGWLLYLLPPAVILVLLMQSSALVSFAAIAGAGACIGVSGVVAGWRETLARLRQRLPELMASAMRLIIIAATVGLLLGVLYSTGIAIAGAVWIGKIGQSNLMLALVLTAGAAFVLGMGVATVGVYIVAATLLAPGLIAAGIPPMAAHFFVLYCGTLSMITPPVAFAALAASTLARAEFTATSLAAMRFGWVLFAMPFLIALRPGILMIGPWPDIAIGFLSVFAFILAATAGSFRNWRRAGPVIAAGLSVGWWGADVVAGLLSLLALASLALLRAGRAGP